MSDAAWSDDVVTPASLRGFTNAMIVSLAVWILIGLAFLYFLLR